MTDDITPVPVIRDAIGEVLDRKRMKEGILACMLRPGDFSSELEMQLAGIAMVPEARQLMSKALTEYWETRTLIARITEPVRSRSASREIILGAGYHAAVYAATRVRMGFPKPVVLEKAPAGLVGGAFAVSLEPVFRLNSRSRPGAAGLPDQDKGLNVVPGGPIQPAMLSSEEYPTNADMAWAIRVALAQFAEVYPGIEATGITRGFADSLTLATSLGDLPAGRIIDARGAGQPVAKIPLAGAATMLTFPQLMQRMGTLFPLRGMRQVAIIGGGNSGLCAAESLLGIAPGNSSAIGLDYVTSIDLYATTVSGRTCSEFRDAQRGRYIRLAQYLAGNASNASTRLRIIPEPGRVAPLPGGVLVNDRTYDLAIMCTGNARPELAGAFAYFKCGADGTRVSLTPATAVASRATPYQCYRVGPAAALPLTPAETAAGLKPPSELAMFRLGPRTAALAASLPALEATS